MVMVSVRVHAEYMCKNVRVEHTTAFKVLASTTLPEVAAPMPTLGCCVDVYTRDV